MAIVFLFFTSFSFLLEEPLGLIKWNYNECCEETHCRYHDIRCCDTATVLAPTTGDFEVTPT